MTESDSRVSGSGSDHEREEMLQYLVHVMASVHRARRVRRRAVVVVMGLAVFGVIMIRPLLQYDSRRADSADFDASEATRIVQIIETDPTTCQRFAARGTGRAQFIDDEVLRRVLVSINRPGKNDNDGDHQGKSIPGEDEAPGT